MYKLQLMHPKEIKNKLRMKAINYACLKLEEKATRNVKKKKIYFANVIEDNFVIIACIGVSTPSPSKTIPPSFSLSPPLNLQTDQVPPLLAIPPYILFFWEPLLKNLTFQWNPIISEFFVLTPSHLLKVTKFLFKIFNLRSKLRQRKWSLFINFFVIKYFRF